MRREVIFRKTRCFDCIGEFFFFLRIFFEKFDFPLQGMGILGFQKKSGEVSQIERPGVFLPSVLTGLCLARRIGYSRGGGGHVCDQIQILAVSQLQANEERNSKWGNLLSVI